MDTGLQTAVASNREVQRLFRGEPNPRNPAGTDLRRAAERALRIVSGRLRPVAELRNGDKSASRSARTPWCGCCSTCSSTPRRPSPRGRRSRACGSSCAGWAIGPSVTSPTTGRAFPPTSSPISSSHSPPPSRPGRGPGWDWRSRVSWCAGRGRAAAAGHGRRWHHLSPHLAGGGRGADLGRRLRWTRPTSSPRRCAIPPPGTSGEPESDRRREAGLRQRS